MDNFTLSAVGLIFILYLAFKFGKVYVMLEENEEKQKKHRSYVESQIKIMHDNILNGTRIKNHNK